MAGSIVSRPAWKRDRQIVLVGLAVVLLLAVVLIWRSLGTGAVPPTVTAGDDRDVDPVRVSPKDAFQRTWQRTDGPVASGAAMRTWMWGQAPLAPDSTEAYAESPGGMRAVRYYDKARMEVTDPNGDASTPWHVTNGLLVVELITGRLQLGANQFDDRSPAQQSVAGDPGGSGPTYATLAGLLDAPPLADGAPVIQRLDGAGNVTVDNELLSHGVTAAERVSVPGIDHQVASPFWTFMQSSGVIIEDGAVVTGPLFENPFYATGYPITEAYWATVSVAGTPHEVLLQCFERRCLTYTPSNQPGWQVESGNVGAHYQQWRYQDDPPSTVTPTVEPTATTPAPTASATTPPPPVSAPVVVGPGAVDAWMRSIVRDQADRVWIVAMNNNAARAGTGPGELCVYRATGPGIPNTFEHVQAALVTATGNGLIPFGDAAIDGQNRLHVSWVDQGAAGQPLHYRILDLDDGTWTGPATTIDTTNLSGYGGLPGQGGVSIALDFDGNPRVAYTVAGFHTQIRTRAFDGVNWGAASEPLLVEGAWVWHPALALAPDGSWHLAAYDGTNRTIVAVSDSGGGWSQLRVVANDVLGPENIDQSPALLVTPAGIPVLTYLDGQSHIRVSQFTGGAWVDVAVGGDYHTHAPGLGVFADGTLIIAGHNEGSPPTALNAIQGAGADWGAWTEIAQIQADGSEVFRWAGAFSSPSANVVDLVFFDEDTNDDSVFDDQTLYYLAVPLE